MARRTIGKLASQAGVNVETVRYYERRGLLDRPESSGGGRHYNQESVFLIRFIKLMQGLGFALREIQDLLSYLPDEVSFCRSAKVAAETKIFQLEKDLLRLTEIRDVLRTAVEECERMGDSRRCPAWTSLFRGIHLRRNRIGQTDSYKE